MRQEKLSNLLDISIGRTPSRNKSEYWGEGHPWVSIRDLSSKIVTGTKEQITNTAVKDARCKIVKKGTLLFSFKLTIGKMAFAGCDLFTNEAIAAFAIKDEKKLNSEFLFYALQSATYEGSNQAVMGKTLNSKSLAEIKIPLPPLNDQIRIAHLLGKVEGLIAQRKQHLQKLDHLLKSVFLEMFGDPVRNEKGWETSELENLCAQVIDCPHSTPVYSDEATGYYCIRSGDIVDGYLDLTKTLQVEKPVYEERIKRYTPKHNDIVYSREGGRLGNAARILGTESICLGQRIMLFKTGEENSAEFFWALLESRPFKAKLQGLVGGGAAPRVNIKDLKNIIVIKPALEIQGKFSVIVKHVDSIKYRYQQSLNDLESLYGALSQQAFKGELDLSRVPLPDIQAKTEEANPLEQAEMPEEDIAINLPDTDYLLDALTDVSLREHLLHDWLESYCQQIGNTAFSTDKFLAAAQTRIAELHPDNDFELDASDYDIVKNWVFDALATGKLTQSLDEANNRLRLRKGKPA